MVLSGASNAVASPRKPMKFATVLFSLLMPLFPQAMPEAKDLLKQSGDALNKFRSYQYEIEMAMDVTVGSNPIHVLMTNSVAAINPGKKRVETKTQATGATSTIVSDGECTWFYNSGLNLYSKRAALQGPQSIGTSLGLGQLPDLAQLFKDVKTVGDDAIEIGGRKFDCWLLEARLDKFATAQMPSVELSECVVRLWISKDQKISLQTTMTGKMRGGQFRNPPKCDRR
jgi:outer membrane lipoprotein-sorting protein